jgi:hypothetical protein
MTGRLPKTQQRLEHVHTCALDADAIHSFEHTAAVTREQRVIELPLRRLQLHFQRLLDARRKLRRDLVLGAAEDHRAHRFRQELAAVVFVRPLPRGHESGDRAERRGWPEHSWIQKLEQTP